MRILQPPNYICSAAVENLRLFFDTEKEIYFRRAMRGLCKFYRLPSPRVVWYTKLGHSNSDTILGYCTDHGWLQLIHPEDWKKKRKYKTQAHWVRVVLHEMGHYSLWANTGKICAETKADRFMRAILKGAK